jgi:hypothetical protein
MPTVARHATLVPDRATDHRTGDRPGRA